MKKSDGIITVKADSPAYGGFARARGKRSVLLIKNAIPGETVVVKIEDQKKDFAFASIVRIFAASPDRIEPQCPVFGVCGSCHHQYISYPRQILLKEEILRDCIRRTVRKEFDLSKPFLGASPWQFRYRGRFKLDAGIIGFFRENSREIVDIDRCALMKTEVNALFAKAREIYKDSPSLFDGVSELHISYGNVGSVLLKSVSNLSTARQKQIGMLFLDTGFKGVCVMSEKGKIVNFGDEHISLGLDGLKYTVSPRSFFQGHWDLNVAVVSFLRQTLHPLEGQRVIALYAGSNFSLPLAFDGADVYAVEKNHTVIEDGMRNAAANGIRNCRFIECSAERLKVSDKVDTLVVAAPKPGLSNRVLGKILTLEPDKIVYISCNPFALAHGMNKLLSKYEIESMRIIDCLPHTYYIKSITVLRLR